MSADASPLRFASALSTAPSSEEALREACGAVREQLGAVPDLAFLFFSPHYLPNSDRIAAAACELLSTENLLGCTGESIVGVSKEVEQSPAMSLWAAHWPGVSSSLFHLEFERTQDGGVINGWPDSLAGEWPPGTSLLLLGEPFSFPADLLLERFNEDRVGVPIIGGMASGAQSPGDNRLILGRESFAEGAVAALVHGPVRMRTVVSQGCRPIGRHFVVTKAERNIIYELGGKPALLQLKELFDTLPTREKVLVQSGLHVGRVVSEYQDSFEQGDFLVRNVVGIDPNAGAVAVGDYIRVGQTIQFHIRDAETADAELKQLLTTTAKSSSDSPAGALLFTCNGRGTRLFGEESHDARVIEAALGDIPLAGFFAQGELGPVGGQNFMHGFTASAAIFDRP